jgi:hypothetical protein
MNKIMRSFYKDMYSGRFRYRVIDGKVWVKVRGFKIRLWLIDEHNPIYRFMLKYCIGK